MLPKNLWINIDLDYMRDLIHLKPFQLKSLILLLDGYSLTDLAIINIAD